MRCVAAGIPWTTNHNPFSGDVGRALYVSPAGVADATEINYRTLRLLSVGPAHVCLGFPATGDGPLGLEAHVALAKNGDPLEWTLPLGYLDTQFAINVRPHLGGLELDTISGGQIVQTEGGATSPIVLGTVQVLQITKLDGGGVRVWFRYYLSAEGSQPETFEIHDTADPATINTVSVAAISPHNYYVDVIGLVDGTAYTFAICGLADDVVTELATFEVNGDDAGPDLDLTLVSEVW